MKGMLSGAVAALLLCVGIASADDGPGSASASGTGPAPVPARSQSVAAQVRRLLCLAAGGTLPADSDLRALQATSEELRRDPELAAKAEALHPLVGELERATRGDAAPVTPAGFCGPSRSDWVGSGAKDAPPNDSCASATVIGDGAFSGTTAEATNDGEASCGASMFAPDVWFRYVAAASGMVGADTLGSGFDTVLSVHTGCPGTMTNQLSCSDDAYGLDSAVAFSVPAGWELLIRVSGYGGATGDYRLHVGPAAMITGVVEGAGTGTLQSAGVRAFDASGAYVGSDTTDATGAYAIGNLLGGTYFVATGVNSLPFVDELYDDLPCPGGAPSGCDPTTGTPVTATIGAVTDGVDFELDRGGVITGTVTENGAGTPVADAWVRVYDPAGSEVGSTGTSASGSWTVEGLLPGDYFVVVDHPWYADELYDDHPCVAGCDPLDGDPIAAQLNTTTSGVDFALDRLGTVSGRVTEVGTGTPLEGDRVEVFDASGDWVEDTATDGNGDYLVGGLAAGTYFLRTNSRHHVDELYEDLPCEPECTVTMGAPVAVTDGTTTPGIDFELVPLGRLTGTVTDEGTGEAIPSVDVRAYDALGGYQGYAGTAGDGSFLVPDLATGSYFVVAEAGWHGFASELYDDLPCFSGCEVGDGTPVAVTNGSTTGGVDFSLARLGAISGAVTDAATGIPIPGLRVEAWTLEGRSGDADTDAAGTYSVDHLPPGEYFVVTDRAGALLDELYQEIPCVGGPWEGCDPTSGTPVTVSFSTVTEGVDFTLRRGGAMTGAVIAAATGSPLSGVRVTILDASGIERGSAWTEADGSWEVVGLVAGSYSAIARKSGYGTVVYEGLLCPEWPDPGCDPTIGTPISVTLGATTTGVDFALGRLGGFSGVVVNALTGHPAPYMSVSAFAGDGVHRGGAETDPFGFYTVGGLYPGSYFASTGGDGLAPEVYDNVPCPGGACIPTAGTPIVVSLDHTTPRVDFALDPNGAISGIVTDEITGGPVTDGQVEVWSPTGEWLGQADLEPSGEYRLENLPPGPCFVSTHYSSGYLEELYDDLPCPAGCDPTKGTRVLVPSGGVASGVDFALRLRGSGILGVVRSAEAGEGIAGVRVDVWDSVDREPVGSTLSSATGAYLVALGQGSYRVSTDNRLGLVDEVYRDHECLRGSALDGTCDFGQGELVTVTSGELTTGVDFALRRATPLPRRVGGRYGHGSDLDVQEQPGGRAGSGPQEGQAIGTRGALVASSLVVVSAGLAAGADRVVGTMTVDGARTPLTYVAAELQQDPEVPDAQWMVLLLTDVPVAEADRTPARLSELARAGKVRGVRVLWKEMTDTVYAVPYHPALSEPGRRHPERPTIDLERYDGERFEGTAASKMLSQRWFFQASVKAALGRGGVLELEPPAAM